MLKKQRKDRLYVLDSYALLVYFQKQPGWIEVGSILRLLKRQKRTALLNWINWGEIYYIVLRNYGAERAKETLELLTGFPVILEPIDLDLVRSAAEFKAGFNLSYADAFCAATALRHNAILITGDPEFRNVESEISIRWV